LKHLAPLLALAAIACGEDPPAPSGPPNVLLVSVDTLRADALEPYGGKAPTPVLMRLAREGTSFDQALAPSPTTAPSHASLFTGQEPLRHGVNRNGASLPAAALTLSEHFQQNGYRTAGFVSSFILGAQFGWSQGFETYDAAFSEAGASVRGGAGMPPDFGEKFSFAGFDRRADATTQAARAWLASAEEPFFLFVHYFDPHNPYVPPDRFAAVLPPGAAELGDRAVPGMTPGELREAIRLYHGEVAFVDAELGRLLEGLERLGHPTLVVVTADHGEGLGQRGLLDHALHLHDELLRVPLIFWWSDRPLGGLRLRTPIGLADVAPTIVELAGLPPLSETDGHSLAASVATGREPDAREIVGYRRPIKAAAPERRSAMYFVRLGRWKLLRVEGSGDALYDLEADAGESYDLRALRPDQADRLGSVLEARLASRRDAVPAPAPSPEVQRGLEALGYVE
jgi:choline-sulfatase